MNADAAVMEFMPKRLTVEESDVLAERIQKRLAERGFGLFAAELRACRSVRKKKESFTILAACSWKCGSEVRLNPIQLLGSGYRASCGHGLHNVGPFLRREMLIGHYIEPVASGASANGEVAALSLRQQFGETAWDHIFRGVGNGLSEAGRQLRSNGGIRACLNDIRLSTRALVQLECDELIAEQRRIQQASTGGDDGDVLLAMFASVGDGNGFGRGWQAIGPKLVACLGIEGPEAGIVRGADECQSSACEDGAA
jgi:hypothetical protein